MAKHSPLKRLMEKPANIIVPMILFILLSPGFLFRIENRIPIIKKIPFIKEIPVVIMHALIFSAIHMLLLLNFPEFYY